MDRRITDEQMFESLDYLRDENGAISRARARRLIIEEGRKNLKARLMQESAASAAAKKEADAYAHPEYRHLLLQLQEAIEADEHFRLQLEYHRARIEIWRTQAANQRAIDRVT